MLVDRGAVLKGVRGWLGRGAIALLMGSAGWPTSTYADSGRSFATEVACEKSPGLGPLACRQAFRAARAEFESKTRAYPNRFSCFRAYGPCMPWPIGAGAGSRFRPQWMGVQVGGPAATPTAMPQVAPGRIRLALLPRALTDAASAMASADAAGAEPFTGKFAATSLCQQIESVAARAQLPPTFLARLLWQESSFRADVVSPAGAAGIAQFMPATAEERGLDNPFDAARAIESSAALLSDLARRFGNLGLAAAAYNGGPARVAGWLKGQRTLAVETQDYVQRITGRPVEDWATRATAAAPAALPGPCRFPSPGQAGSIGSLSPTMALTSSANAR